MLCCLTRDFTTVNTTFWEKLLLFPWADVSAPGQGLSRQRDLSACAACYPEALEKLLWAYSPGLSLRSTPTDLLALKPLPKQNLWTNIRFPSFALQGERAQQEGGGGPPLSLPCNKLLRKWNSSFLSSLAFFNQSFSQSIGTWKYIGERKSSKIIQSTTTSISYFLKDNIEWETCSLPQLL